MTDTAEIAGTRSGLKALDEETIADLRAQLAARDAEVRELEMRNTELRVLLDDSVPLSSFAERDAEVGRLREVLLDVLKVNPDAPDCIDNDGCPYQSQYLADWLSATLKGEE